MLLDLADLSAAASSILAIKGVAVPAATADPTQLSWDHSSSFTSDGQTEFTGNNGFTVTDSYSCGSGACGGYTYTPGAVAEPQQLAFEHSSSFNGDGVEFTGDNGFTVVDNYTCGKTPCGSWTYTPPSASTAVSAPQQLAWDHSSSFTSDGTTEFTGNNGFTVVDTYTCGKSGGCGGFSVPSTATAEHTQALSLIPKQLAWDHSSSFTSDGSTEFTGNNGFTVVDTYTCGKSGGCGGFSVPSTAAEEHTQALSSVPEHQQLAWDHSSSFTSDGSTEFTGNNGFTVSDTYSCGKTGGCGGFSVPSTATAEHTQALSSTYTDSQGNTFDGCSGYTVTDSYSCKSGACGGFTVGSFASGLTPPASCAIAAPVDVPMPKTSKPSPGSFMLCGHAMILGAVEATVQMGKNAMNGQEVSASAWSKTFDYVSASAASAISPISAFMLQNHVLAKAQ